MLDKDLIRGRGGAISVTTWERILNVYIRHITFNNQAHKKSPRAEGVRL
jgi:hypothetical protein